MVLSDRAGGCLEEVLFPWGNLEAQKPKRDCGGSLHPAQSTAHLQAPVCLQICRAASGRLGED